MLFPVPIADEENITGQTVILLQSDLIISVNPVAGEGDCSLIHYNEVGQLVKYEINMTPEGFYDYLNTLAGPAYLQ